MKRQLATVAVAILLAVSLAWGQLGVGAISGRVTDVTGAIVPGARVTITNTDTNFTYSSITNGEGIFRVPSLQPGPYRVAIETEGFKRFVRENLDLRSGQTLPVNAALEVGAVTEQVEVTAESPLLETETSVLGATVEGQVMYDLPNYQRYAASTMNFVPGITSGGYAYGGGLGNYHVAGQRGSALGAFDDGVTTNDQQSGTNYVKPVLNSVEEIKILTTNIPAEYGHSGGGVMDIVKKTGTNQYHGMASMYGRSRRMQHRLFFDKEKTSQPQPGLPDGSQVMFLLPDANIGGPIVKNKTFFFAGWQHLIEKKTAQAFGRTPTQEMKNGDFSFGGIGNPIFDPASTSQLADGTWVRDALPNNRVPLSRFDPVARSIIDIDPWVAPNQDVAPNALGPLDNLRYNDKARVFFHDYSIRLDHQFSQNFKIFGSTNGNTNQGLGRPPRNIRLLEFDARDGNLTPQLNQNWSIGNTWIVNPTMIIETRVGYNRRNQTRTVPSEGQGWPGQLGIPNVPDTLLPAFGPSGTGPSNTPESLYGLAVHGGFKRIHETRSLRSDLTKIHGKHSFKMGYEILKFYMNSTQVDTPSGDFRFDQMTAGLQAGGQPVPNTGNTFAGFLLGYVRQATFTSELAAWHPRSNVQSVYFQDDWKVTPTITVNWGLRYSNESQFDTQYGQHSNFDPTAIDPVTGLTGGLVFGSGALAPRDANNFQPRLGMAWNFSDKWVFRSGFGVNTIDIKFPLFRGNFAQYVATAVDQSPPGDPRPVYRISEKPTAPVFPVLPNGTSPYQGQNFSSRNADWWDPNLRNPYAMNWNAGVQRTMGPNYVLELSYQGSSGVGLVERWEQNAFPTTYGENDPELRQAAFDAPQDFRPWPHFGSVQLRCNCGHSSYHSGTVKLEKRYSAGLNFITFYTWSKTMSSRDGDNDGGGVAPLTNRNLEKSLAGFHREHRWVGTATYELPFGPGKRWANSTGPVTSRLYGGWEISIIQTLESGNPLNFSFSGSPSNYYPTWVGERRPDAAAADIQLFDDWRSRVYNSPDRFSTRGIAPVIDINNFAYPAAFTPGTLGRNAVIGPNLVWTQISIQKNVNITERIHMQVRWDMQNAFKHYNFNPPSSAVNFQDVESFGKVTSDPRTASIGGQPLMNLTVMVRF